MIYIEYIKRNGKPIQFSSRPIEASSDSAAILKFNGDVGPLMEYPFRISGGNVEILGWHENRNMVFDYDIGDWVDVRGEQEIIATAAQDARHKRDGLLAGSDWSQLPDAPTDRAAWAAYRRALRDVTEQAGWPHDIEWPTPPM